MDVADSILDIRRKKSGESSRTRVWSRISAWLLAWEIYPITLLAIFIHFYGLSTTEFDADQAILFKLPHAAVVHGLIPATGTIASIGMINPPGYVYLLMPIAALTANPLADVLFTAFLNVVAVILTYTFTRRYYGRLAGTVAALLYTTTFWDVFYGRFVWQPNLLPFFTILFMLALFRGAVERKSGWFAVALPLLGFMLQLHATPVYLVIPFALTLVLAYKTVRLRDLVIGLGVFALLFSTYLVWEISTHFADVQVLLNASHNSAHFDTQALRDYVNFLVPYVVAPYFPLFNNPQSVLYHLVPLLKWERWVMYAVTLGGFLVASFGLLGWKSIQPMSHSRFPDGEVSDIAEASSSSWQKVWHWWNALRVSPQRCGFLLLLAWQIPPLLLISHRTIDLQPQYFLIFLPGPFIFIGLLFRQVTSWCEQLKNAGRLLRFVVPALSLLLVLLQFTGSFGWFFDETHGYFSHGTDYNTWQDVQGAVDAADHLAQVYHLHRVYLDTGIHTYETLKYLAGQMQTPATVLSTSNCLVLPATAQGPAVMLLGPENMLDDALLNRFASATLISQPPRLGGAPFRLYIVQPLSVTSLSQATFAHSLTLHLNQPDMMAWNDPAGATKHMFETHWTNLQNLPAAYGTMYTYHFDARYSGHNTDGQTGSAECSFSSLLPGDQLLIPFQLPTGSVALPASLAISGSTWSTQPYELHYGPFHFESILDQRSTLVPLGPAGGETITFQH
jgi:4-amino-4-deoxy-L-arabinose transferase-like glycosyltransferase